MKTKHDDLIKRANDNSMALLNSVSLFELSAQYKTRRVIRLSDQEIKEEKERINHELIRLMFSIHIAEKFIEEKGLNEEYLKMTNEVILEVAEKTKPKATVEKTEDSSINKIEEILNSDKKESAKIDIPSEGAAKIK